MLRTGLKLLTGTPAKRRYSSGVLSRVATSSTRQVETFSLQSVEDEFVKRVGLRIRRERQARGWTQLQLANAMVGEHYSSQISVWERGRAMPSIANLETLADALGVPVETFFSDPSAAADGD
jgi:ribosome-binding protein aMBF1 (putative translation factor)